MYEYMKCLHIVMYIHIAIGYSTALAKQLI